MVRIKYLIIIALLLFPVAVRATTPAISNVTGTVSTGQTLTITGTTMMDEDKTNWHSRVTTGNQYGFEGTSVAGDNWDDWGIDTSDGYVTDVKLSGSKSIRYRATGVSTDYWHSPGYHEPQTACTMSTSNFYFRGYVRYQSLNGIWYGDISPSDGSDLKMFMTAGSGGNGNAFWQPLTRSDGTIPTDIAMSADVNGSNTFLGDNAYTIPWKETTWHCIEGRYSQSSHLISMWVDGVYKGDITNLNSSSAVAWYMGQVTGWSTPANFQLDMWVDNLAFSSTRVYPSSTVEISGDNGSTWKYQYPTSISDTLVAITADLPSLTHDHYLLRVTNNKQETSSSYNLSGGGGSSTGSLRPGVSASGVTFR